jgi:hypothetical protein
LGSIRCLAEHDDMKGTMTALPALGDHPCRVIFHLSFVRYSIHPMSREKKKASPGSPTPPWLLVLALILIPTVEGERSEPLSALILVGKNGTLRP